MAPGPNGWRMRSPLIDPRQRQIFRQEDLRRDIVFVMGCVCLAVGIAIGAALLAASIVMGG